MTTDLVIDCDGHILEPPDLWETYLEPRYRDRALRIRVGSDGFEFLEIDGRPSTIARQGQLGTLGGMGKRVDEARESATGSCGGRSRRRTRAACVPPPTRPTSAARRSARWT